MHMRGHSVAGFPTIDDDDVSLLPRELQRGGQSRGGSADDSDIAVPLDWIPVSFA